MYLSLKSEALGWGGGQNLTQQQTLASFGMGSDCRPDASLARTAWDMCSEASWPRAGAIGASNEASHVNRSQKRGEGQERSSADFRDPSRNTRSPFLTAEEPEMVQHAVLRLYVYTYMYVYMCIYIYIHTYMFHNICASE